MRRGESGKASRAHRPLTPGRDASDQGSEWVRNHSRPELARAISASQLYGNAKSAKLDCFSVEFSKNVAIVQRITGRGALAENPDLMMLEVLGWAGFEARQPQLRGGVVSSELPRRRVPAWTSLLLCCTLLLAACGSREQSRYRMTVDIETPAGVRSGSAVREVERYTPPNIPMLGEDRGGISVKGEAVSIDLTPKETIFALLTSENGDSDYAATLPDRALRSAIMPEDPRVLRNAQSAELWPNAPRTYRFANADRLPIFVRFRDIKDPLSLEVIKPEEFSQKLGSGYRLVRVRIELTEDPVTNNLKNKLNWIDDIKKYRSVKNNPFTTKLPREISGLRRD